MEKRAAIYLRVSTDSQAENGFSLPTQLEGCRQYCQRMNFEIVAELADDITGQLPIIERPAGAELYDLVDAGKVDAVVLYTHDRTARDDRLVEYLLFKDYLNQAGVELHFSDSGLDPKTLEADLVGFVKSLSAAQERRMITERTNRSKRRILKSGRWIPMGAIPYGSKKVGKVDDAKFEIEPFEAGIIEQIFIWAGVEGLTLQEIVDRLAEMGVKSPTGMNVWNRDTLARLTNNRIYIGKPVWGRLRTDKKNKHKVLNPRDNWIEVDAPELRIISDELFQLAREQAKKR